jgi:mRNA export factor
MFGDTSSMQQTHNPNKDVEVTQPPTDGISSLAFSPKANYLVATSWDNYVSFFSNLLLFTFWKVRCWEVQGNGSTVAKASHTHEGPVLCSAWSGDGTRVFSGGCDNKAKCWSLQTGQSSVVAQHAAAIKGISWVDEMNLLVTGSWDKTVKYWDGRQSNPVHTAQLPERVYCMDVKYPLAVVGTADRSILIYDLRKPNVEFKVFYGNHINYINISLEIYFSFKISK